MKKHNGKLTEELIWTMASEIRCERAMHTNTNEVAGDCEAISNSLVSSFSIPAKRVFLEVGSEREPHHAVAIQMRDVADGEFDQSYSDDALLLIDATIEQFSHENKRNGVVGTALADADDLPRVGIYPPRCKERMRWYFMPDDSNDSFDVLDSLDPSELLNHSNPTIV